MTHPDPQHADGLFWPPPTQGPVDPTGELELPHVQDPLQSRVEMSQFGAVVMVVALAIAAIGLVVFISIDETPLTLDDNAAQSESPAVEIPSAAVAAAEPPTTAPTESPAPTTTTPSTTAIATASTTSATAAASATADTVVVSGYPTTVADVIEVKDHKTTKIYVLDNDGSGDSPLDIDSLEIVTAPRHAKEYEIKDDGHIRYKSTKDFAGTDSLEYIVCNTNDLCTTGTVTINVVPK